MLDSESHVEHDAAACHAADGVEVRLDHLRDFQEQEGKAQDQLAQRGAIEQRAAAEAVQLGGDAFGGVDQLVGFCLRTFPIAILQARHGRRQRVRAACDYSLVGMKIAYVFSTSGHTASYKLGRMILPQLETGTHGVKVVGMFFFDDNTYVLRAGDPVGERLGRVAAEHGILLMLCDQCALERGLAEGEIGAALPAGTVAGVRVGCFPDLYEALAGDPPDHVITL